MPFYGADVWDPVLIVAEMVMMQVCPAETARERCGLWYAVP